MILLEDFVAETLTQIIGGVKRAQEDNKETGASINHPAVVKSTVGGGVMLSNGGAVIERVHFDVVLTTNEKEGAKGKIGVFSGFFGVGGELEGSSENQSVNRIKFAIPVRFPEPY